MHCPFLIMCKVSIPASSFLALQNNLNTSIGAVTRFTARYRYFHYSATLAWVSSIRQLIPTSRLRLRKTKVKTGMIFNT